MNLLLQRLGLLLEVGLAPLLAELLLLLLLLLLLGVVEADVLLLLEETLQFLLSVEHSLEDLHLLLLVVLVKLLVLFLDLLEADLFTKTVLSLGKHSVLRPHLRVAETRVNEVHAHLAVVVIV